jgi:hypothetical protein
MWLRCGLRHRIAAGLGVKPCHAIISVYFACEGAAFDFAFATTECSRPDRRDPYSHSTHRSYVWWCYGAFNVPVISDTADGYC